MNKAPDTRNKLDSNKGLNKRTITSKKKNKITYRASFQEFKEEAKAIDSPIKLKGEKKPTKGQLFKKEKGYSKTMKRNLQKHSQLGKDLISLADYRQIRKTRKKKEKKIRQEKHQASVLYKRTNKKTKGSSGSKPASKTKSK